MSESKNWNVSIISTIAPLTMQSYFANDWVFKPRPSLHFDAVNGAKRLTMRSRWTASLGATYILRRRKIRRVVQWIPANHLHRINKCTSFSLQPDYRRLWRTHYGRKWASAGAAYHRRIEGVRRRRHSKKNGGNWEREALF
jgi:hypothetical protein